MDRSLILEDEKERERLRRLVAQLNDDDFVCTVWNGWSVASVLAHLAFWDRRLLVMLEKLERSELTSPPARMDAGVVNDAMRPLCLAIPGRVAAQLALDAAEEVDRKIASVGPQIIDQIEAVKNPIRISRAGHRREHLDQIEQVVRANRR